MTRSSYVALRVAGVHCVQFPEQIKSLRGRLLKDVFILWHYIAVTILIVSSIITFMAIFQHHVEKLHLIVEFMRLASVTYMSLVFRYQRKKFQHLMINIQQSLSLFPNATIKEHNYYKIVAFVAVYTSVQGNY